MLEGRDTGSVVCPDADLKIYLVASSEVRAARRAAELEMPVDEVERSIVQRDELDSEQLAPAPDAVVIDSSELSVRGGGGADRGAPAGGPGDAAAGRPLLADGAARGRAAVQRDAAPVRDGSRARAAPGAGGVRRQPPVAVGHPGARRCAAAGDPLHGQVGAVPAAAVRRLPADGRHLRRAPRRARPRGAAHRARDARGRRHGGRVHPGPPPGRLRGGQGRRRADRRGRAGRRGAGGAAQPQLASGQPHRGRLRHAPPLRARRPPGGRGLPRDGRPADGRDPQACTRAPDERAAGTARTAAAAPAGRPRGGGRLPERGQVDPDQPVDIEPPGGGARDAGGDA